MSYLTIAGFKERMRIDGDFWDASIQSYLDAAEQYLGDVDNGILGRPVEQTEFTEAFCGFSAVSLAHPDEVSGVTVTYAKDGVEQPVGPIYTVKDGRLSLNVGEAWPEADNVSVTYLAGWAIVPATIAEAGYFYAGTLWRHNTAESAKPDTARKMVALMVAPFRRIGL